MNPGQIAYLPAGGRGAVQQPLLQPRAAVNTVSQQTGKCYSLVLYPQCIST